ncbi:MAG TPA: hypothetical protein VEW93_07585 [Acidimicrobiales bacterium]|nr:hypothetical protein [Acidimicrobiales bacterium]
MRIAWDATTGGDPAASYQINLSTYQGTVVALVPASVRSCDITGLAASTAYTIVVTARDAQQHWSGPLTGTKGNRTTTITTTITTTSHGGSGTLWCHPTTDTDGDGLPNALETDDGTYTSASDAGTDSANPDTDDDGIPDGEEVLGLGGLNLRAMGARATHKDLFLETDWLDVPACPTGLRPTATAVTAMAGAFAAAPVLNPDGTGGINLIADYGQGGGFTGGNAITEPDGVMDDNPNGPEFEAAKSAHFQPARLGVFHYVIMLPAGGLGEVFGNDFTLGVRCNDPDPGRYARFLMHELGHNLGLQHGGNLLFANRFPNYASVMNYRYTDAGIDTDCDGEGDAAIGYSQGLNAPLDESDLDERDGICAGVDIDWDEDGTIEPSVQYDINGDGQINLALHDGTLLLSDHDDWALIEQRGLRCVRVNEAANPPTCVSSRD